MTKTSFKNHLMVEGVIQVPRVTLVKLERFFTTWFLSRLWSMTTDQKVHDHLTKLATDYGVTANLEATAEKAANARGAVTSFKMSDLPSSYLSKLGPSEVEAIKSQPIKFTVALRKHPSVDFEPGRPHGMYHGGETPEIAVSAYNMQLTMDQALRHLELGRVDAVRRSLNHSLGIIEHELTHAIQDLVMAKLHSKQFDQSGRSAPGLTKNQAKDDQYYTAPVEFDPHVKDSVREVKRLIAAGKSPKQTVINRFTLSDIPADQLSKVNVGSDRSPFFRALKRSAPDQWKKAVKLLYNQL